MRLTNKKGANGKSLRKTGEEGFRVPKVVEVSRVGGRSSIDIIIL